jgi:hypothetical protein
MFASPLFFVVLCVVLVAGPLYREERRGPQEKQAGAAVGD